VGFFVFTAIATINSTINLWLDWRVADVSPAPTFLNSPSVVLQRQRPFSAAESRASAGHKPPVGVTFQFLLVVRPVIEVSVRYSAIKLRP
jgi:hypothetical protein